MQSWVFYQTKGSHLTLKYGNAKLLWYLAKNSKKLLSVLKHYLFSGNLPNPGGGLFVVVYSG